MHFLLALLLVSSFIYAYIWRQICFKPIPINNPPFYFVIEHGTSLRQLTRQLAHAGILEHPNLVRWYAICKGYANHIKTGEYKIVPGTTVRQLLKMIVNGQVTQYAFTIVEGLRTADVLQDLHKLPKLKHELLGLNDQQIIAKLAIPATNLEGIFLPDTYNFHAGISDVDFLRRAYFAMQQKLQSVWDARPKDTILKSQYEALILASIIEKESGVFDEYHQISGVYQRRLAKHMRLQADPTVAYFWGDKLPQGKLYIKHLKIDSPYNTYTRYGLPPTPIALPSVKAIEAALNPSSGETLYFVATGDGGHVFSKTLEDHNREVAKFRSKRN